MSFSEKPTLSERNPHYLQIMWVRKTQFISEKPILSDHADNVHFSVKPTLYADNGSFSEKAILSDRKIHFI